MLRKSYGPVHLDAVDKRAGRIDLDAVVRRPPAADGVEVLERESDGSITLWQPAQTASARCASIRSRSESGLRPRRFPSAPARWAEAA